MGVHSVMRPVLEGGGLGTEHGSRVHADAERLVHGMEAWERHPGLDIVRGILTDAEGARVTPELDCLLPVADVMLEGRVDLLVEHEDRVDVHDWKTDVSDRNHEEYVLQLSIYGQAAASLGKPVRCHVHYLEIGESRDFDPLPMDRIEEIVGSRLQDNAR